MDSPSFRFTCFVCAHTQHTHRFTLLSFRRCCVFSGLYRLNLVERVACGYAVARMPSTATAAAATAAAGFPLFADISAPATFSNGIVVDRPAQRALSTPPNFPSASHARSLFGKLIALIVLDERVHLSRTSARVGMGSCARSTKFLPTRQKIRK